MALLPSLFCTLTIPPELFIFWNSLGKTNTRSKRHNSLLLLTSLKTFLLHFSIFLSSHTIFFHFIEAWEALSLLEVDAELNAIFFFPVGGLIQYFSFLVFFLRLQEVLIKDDVFLAQGNISLLSKDYGCTHTAVTKGPRSDLFARVWLTSVPRCEQRIWFKE